MSAKTKAEFLTDPPPRKSPARILGNPELRAMLPFGETCQFEMEKRGEFPPRFAISPRRSGWLESEVLEWIEKKAAERATGPRPLNAPPARVVARVKPVASAKHARRGSARGAARA